MRKVPLPRPGPAGEDDPREVGAGDPARPVPEEAERLAGVEAAVREVEEVGVVRRRRQRVALQPLDQ